MTIAWNHFNFDVLLFNNSKDHCSIGDIDGKI